MKEIEKNKNERIDFCSKQKNKNCCQFLFFSYKTRICSFSRNFEIEEKKITFLLIYIFREDEEFIQLIKNEKIDYLMFSRKKKNFFDVIRAVCT